MFVPQASLGVDEVVRRPVAVVEGLPDGPVVVGGDGIGDPQVRNGLADVGLFLLEGEFRGVHTDDHQALVPVPLGPGLDIGDRAQAVDAGIGPEVDQHHLALQRLGGKRRAVQPGRGAREAGHGAHVRQRLAGLALVGLGLRRIEAGDQPLFQAGGRRARQPGQHAAVQAEGHGRHPGQDGDAEDAANPFLDRLRALQRGEHAPTGQQDDGQGRPRADGVGQQQEGGVGARPLQRGGGEDQAEDRPCAGRPQKAGGAPQHDGLPDAGFGRGGFGQPSAQGHERARHAVGQAREQQGGGEQGQQHQGGPAANFVGPHGPAAAHGRQGGDQGEGQGHADQHGQAAAQERPVGAGEDEGQDRQDAGAEDGQHPAQIGQPEQDHAPTVSWAVALNSLCSSLT